jgi:hypothetical protein
MDNKQIAENEITDDRKVESEPVADDTQQSIEKKFTPIIKVKLTEDQEKKIIQLITDEHTKILTEYEEYNKGQGWFDHIDKTNQLIESTKDLDDIDSKVSTRKLGMAQIQADLVASKDKRQTVGAKPMIVLEQLEEIGDIGQLRDREDRLDYILRNDCKVEGLNYIAAQRACINGVSIIKVPYDRKVEYRTKKTQYNQQNKIEFEKIYASDLLNPKSEAFKNWQLIESGQEVEITDIEPVVVFHGVKPYRVDPKKFFARLYKEDFQEHRVISELIDEVSFSDIELCVSDDAYGYEQSAIDRLREKIGSDEKKIAEWRGNKYESIVYIKLESELAEGETKKKEYIQRYLITFEDTHKIVLRCIHYPYDHGKVCYVPITALPRDDSWTGWSFAVRGQDMEDIANGLLNSLMNEFKLAENGVILTDDARTDFNRVSVNNSEGMSVIKMTPGAKFQQFNWDFTNIDRVGMINWITNQNSLKIGVDPAVQSGAETPSDPSAPYAKTALKQANSNARIEDIILNLQKGYELYAEQIESIYNQFIDDKSKPITYYRGETKKEVSSDIYSKKVRYVCQGSRLSFDKNADSAATLGFAQALAQMDPQTMQDVDVLYYLVSILTNNTGGSVERGKDIILKPMKLLSEAKKEIMEYNAKRKEAFWQAGQQAGASEEQIQAKWNEIEAQSKQPGQPIQQPMPQQGVQGMQVKVPNSVPPGAPQGGMPQ